jgi:hypothetical protein
MRTRAIQIALAACFIAASVCFASHLGTWKLNESKSQLTPGTTKNHTVIYEETGDSVTITVDGTNAAGKATHNEWTGKFDGKDYPVTGDPNTDARSYTKVDDHTLEFTGKKAGKVIMSGSIVTSADGTSRTVTMSSTDPQGKKFTNTSVYDKQ